MSPLKSLIFAALALTIAFSPLATRAADARNIAVFGDSLADGVWSGLHQEAKSHAGDKLFRDSKVGTGITKPDIKDFIQEFADTLDRDHITDAVVMFGANDEESLRDDDHKGYVFQSNGWTRVYRARIEALIEACRKHGVRVVWLGLPILRDETLDKGAVFLNGVLQDTITKAGGTYLSIEDDFKGSDGSFASHLPDATGELHEVRAPDGTHFTFYGYDLIAKKVYKELTAADVPPVPAKPKP